MDKNTVFSKTGKGLLEIKNKLNRLPREHLRVLTLVDGKVHFADLAANTRFPEAELRKIITQLCDQGFVKELQATANVASAMQPEAGGTEADDLDFTRVLGPAIAPSAQARSPAAQQRGQPQVLRAPGSAAAAPPLAKASSMQASPVHAPPAAVPPVQARPVPTPPAQAPDQRSEMPVSTESTGAAQVHENTERDFGTDLAALKQAQTQLAAPPSAVETIPFRAHPAAPVAAPDSAPAPVTDAPRQSGSHDLAEAFERARKQAEQQAREEAIRIQQEARERRLRDQRKPK